MLDSVPGLVGYDLSEAEDKEKQKSFSNLQNGTLPLCHLRVELCVLKVHVSTIGKKIW